MRTPNDQRGTTDDQPNGDAPRRAGRRAGVVAVIGVAIGLVVLPVLVTEVPREASRWRVAAAVEKSLDGNLPGAIADVDEALERTPDYVEALLLRSEWHREQGELEAAVADAERAVELAPDDPQAYLALTDAQQAMGRHDLALETWKRLVARQEQGPALLPRATLLNGLAYMRALAREDLDQGLAEVEEAIELGGENSAFLDTRGFLHLQRRDLEQARHDMEQAVKLLRQEEQQVRQQLAERRQQSVDLRGLEKARRQFERGACVILYHRMLVYEILAPRKAVRDRLEIQRRGFEPGQDLY